MTGPDTTSTPGHRMSVHASVICETESQTVHASEVLTRVATSLALEGLYATVSVSRLDDDDDG